MMTEGVSDLTSIKLNDGIKNIPVLEENKAALGGIAYE